MGKQGGETSIFDLDDEVATIEDIAIDGFKRHENSILVNVPKELAELGELATILFMFYMDKDAICDYTGNRTYLNIKESYLMSGVYDSEYLDNIYNVYEKEIVVRRSHRGDEELNYEMFYEVLDKKADIRISAEANRFWNENGLSKFFKAMAIEKMGGIEPTEALRYAIITDALTAKEDIIAHRKMAIDVLGMKVKEKSTSINLRIRGGQEIIDNASKRQGGGFLGSVEEDDEDDV